MRATLTGIRWRADLNAADEVADINAADEVTRGRARRAAPPRVGSSFVGGGLAGGRMYCGARRGHEPAAGT